MAEILKPSPTPLFLAPDLIVLPVPKAKERGREKLFQRWKKIGRIDRSRRCGQECPRPDARAQPILYE